MRILLVSHGYPPYGVAGVERVASQTAASLAARGHEVTVLTRRPSAAPPTLALEREERDGARVVRIAGAGSTFGAFPGHEERLERAFVRMLAEAEPDVVLLSHLLHHSPGYVARAQRWRIPVVLELHDFFSACPLAHLQRVDGELCAGPEGGAACATHCFPRQARALERWTLRCETFADAVRAADAVTAPSRLVADWFAAMRAPSPPIRVLGNGVPPLDAPPRAPRRDPDAPLRIATIGVAIPHKGLHLVLEAARRAALPAIDYVHLGVTTQPYERELRAAAARVPGLRLRCYGRFEPERLPLLLGGVDAVVVPSIVDETYSVAAREALACGIPVLAARAGALPEAIRHGENGLLFARGDADELATLLRRIAGEPELLERLAAGIRPSDWLTLEARAELLEALLAETVRAGARPPSPAAPELARRRDALGPVASLQAL